MNKILFIDDQPNVRIPLLFPRYIWENIYVACGGAQVEYYLTNFNVDLIALDCDMAPMENGLAIARRFLTTRNIPVVIHSANMPGSKKIKATLDEFPVPSIILSCGLQKEWFPQMMKWYANLLSGPSDPSF